ncbi:IMP cyclohydrolase [Candidatus Woesearchaeota archaeon]|nr:IMP cyclohydrolase [Candidatus Woesearchaeota archaeon]|tara:strand:+ start:12352 stop:13581 length:1230 start_codon:yes stop_codon:yes gene_type:complete
MKDYKKSYKEVLGDNFPNDMEISFGEQKLQYRKKKWKFNREEIGLRYGDNPGQEAALYTLIGGNLKLGEWEFVNSDEGFISNLGENELIETGKHIGKSNLADLDAALNILKYFDEPTAVIVKHSNPSGVASRESIKEAYVEANFADRIAAFGGVLVINRKMNKETAEEVVKNYLEVAAAPEFDEDALQILTTRKNMRLMKIKKLEELQKYKGKRVVEFKTLIDGGIMVQQSADNEVKELETAEVEREGKAYKAKQPEEKEIEDMLFGWKVLQGVISNSMLFAKDKVTVAICAGEQDRVGATELAIMKAYKKAADRICFQKYEKPLWELTDKEKKKEIEEEVEQTNANLKGSVLASDGFLPFRDTVDVAAKQNIVGIIQPGGSTRDYQSIEACNEHGISMAFTGKRVFRH